MTGSDHPQLRRAQDLAATLGLRLAALALLAAAVFVVTVPWRTADAAAHPTDYDGLPVFYLISGLLVGLLPAASLGIAAWSLLGLRGRGAAWWVALASAATVLAALPWSHIHAWCIVINLAAGALALGAWPAAIRGGRPAR